MCLMDVCNTCGCRISKDEIGLSKKLINRGLTEFYCIKCLSERFSVDTTLLLKKIEEFRSSGCTLFL